MATPEKLAEMAERGRRTMGLFAEMREGHNDVLARLDRIEERLARLERPWWQQLREWIGGLTGW